MRSLALTLIAGVCAFQMGCSGNADSSAASTGGLSNGIGGGTPALSGGAKPTGGTANAGGTANIGGTSQMGTGTCSAITSASECDARTDCHSVYQDPGTCGCAAVGCCAKFSRCVDGDRAHCETQAVACRMAQPYCEDPAFVISYSGNCYEGCVKPADCDTLGVCGSNCSVSTSLTAPVCSAASQLVLSCAQPYPSDLVAIMTRNGCTEAGLGTSAYCCPPAIQTQCL